MGYTTDDAYVALNKLLDAMNLLRYLLRYKWLILDKRVNFTDLSSLTWILRIAWDADVKHEHNERPSVPPTGALPLDPTGGFLLEPNSTTRTPATDTTNGQAHNNSTTNLPHYNARAQHLDIVKMLGCGKCLSTLVLFVGGVRSRCPCSGVWLLSVGSEKFRPRSPLCTVPNFLLKCPA